MYWVNVNQNTVEVSGSDVIVQDNVNAVNVKFSFSEEWDNLTRMVVFRGSGKIVGIELYNNDPIKIPWECCKKINDLIYIGAYGVDSDGNILRPTTWAQIGRVVDGVDVDGVLSPEQSDSAFGSIIDAIGDLKDDFDNVLTRVSDMSENLNDVENDVEKYSNHQNLNGLNEPNQHPIAAIIGLEKELSPVDYLSPDELKALLGG